MSYWIKQTLLFVFFNLSLCACKKKEGGTASDDPPWQPVEITEEFVPKPQVIPEQKVVTLPINARAPDFKLPGIDGKYYSLASFKNAEVLVILFISNQCPESQSYEERIIDLVKYYNNEPVQVVAISPNSVINAIPEEMAYSDLDDCYEGMKLRARDKSFNFPYLYDGDTQSAALEYGPMVTPYVFVFDKDRRLKYRGRIDGKHRHSNVSDLQAAINAILLDVEILEPITKTKGCKVKWGWQKDDSTVKDREWRERPVELREINYEGLRILMNHDSHKLWMVYVWASWSPVCKEEFPGLLETHRIYQNREFELITLSLDKPDRKDIALGFLQRNQAAVSNFIYYGEHDYDLISEIDRDWNGTIPYTVLIEPDGNIIYQNHGPVDIHELRKAIVDSHMLGREN